MEYYSAIKRNEILPLVTTWMDIKDIYAKWNKSEKDKYAVITYIDSKKIKQTNVYNKPMYKEKQTH